MKRSLFFPQLLLVAALAASCSDKGPVVNPVNNCYLTAMTDSRGINLTLEYNSNNQVIKATPSGGGSPITFGYDSKGNITSLSSGSSTTVLTYDSDNHLITSSNGSGPGSSTITYAYNASGQVVTETYASNGFSEMYKYAYPNTTTKNYSTKTLGTSVTYFEYDTKKFPTSATKALQFTLTDVIPPTDNNFTKRTSGSSPNEMITTYSYQYNDKGYPTTQTLTFPGTTTPEVFTYTYNCK